MDHISAREKWIDDIKGVAILLVVFGHAIQYVYYHAVGFWDDIFFRMIYGFHMALFALISGFLFFDFTRRYNLKDGIKRKIEGILLPIMAWGTIHYIYIYKIYFNVSTWVNTVMYNDWFLWTVFYCSLVGLICLILDKKIWRAAIFVVGLSFIYPDYLNLIYFKMMFPFFIFGYVIAEYNIVGKFAKMKIQHQIFIIILSWATYFILLCRFDKTVISAWTCYSVGDFTNFVIVLKHWLINFIGSISVIMTVWFVDAKNKLWNYAFDTKIGQETLGIYMLQNFIFGHFWIYFQALETWPDWLKIMYTFGMFVLITIVSYGLTQLLNKTKWAKKILLGKKVSGGK